MTHAFRTREQQAENRVERIKAKYQDLVNLGLYEDFDGRSVTNVPWTAIVHFHSKTIYVYAFPIVATSPACYIKSCECGGVNFVDLQPEHEEDPVDMEKVLDAIRKDFEVMGLLRRKPNTDFDGDPAVANPHANKQQHKEMV